MANENTPKRRLLFLTVNSSFSHSSLALPLLHAASNSVTEWEWFRYDMTLGQDIMGAIREMVSFKCDLLVTTLYLFNSKTALEVLQRYHALFPECRIAAGGPECLGDGAVELLTRFPWLDHVFRGEGEEIFKNYLENFDTPDKLPGKISPPEGNAVFKDWTNSPCPVCDPFFVTEKPFVQMETSRGCPMGCYYCTSGGTLPRYRTLEQVREELSILSSKGVKELRILDRTFNLPKSRGAALLRLFREEFPHMKFHLELHPQFLDDNLKNELSLAQPGQLHIETGIQCLDPGVQDLSGRRSKREAVLEGMSFLCSCSAFETHADLLAGLPEQKWEHILNDVSTLISLNVAEIQLELLKVLPGTPLREIAPRHGIKYSPEPPYDVMESGTMTLEEMQHARDLSRILDMTYNHKYLHSVCLELHKECPEFAGKLLEFFHKMGGSANSVWDLKKRFLFLLEFCRANSFEKALHTLNFEWLRAGYPAEQGADLFSKRIPALPEKAVLLEGNGECAKAKESRIYRLSAGEKEFFFAFNRSFALNLPAGIWELRP